jgi:hypothetical protein
MISNFKLKEKHKRRRSRWRWKDVIQKEAQTKENSEENYEDELLGWGGERDRERERADIMIANRFSCPSLLHEGVWDSGGLVPLILNPYARWMWVFSFTPRPPYPRRKSFVTHRRLVAPGSVWKLWREKKTYFFCPELNYDFSVVLPVS